MKIHFYGNQVVPFRLAVVWLDMTGLRVTFRNFFAKGSEKQKNITHYNRIRSPDAKGRANYRNLIYTVRNTAQGVRTVWNNTSIK
jgi:hypothetical protein